MPRTDQLLLLLLLPIAVVVFSLHVYQRLTSGYTQILITTEVRVASDVYPTVADYEAPASAETTPLRPGDRLIRIGDRDLRGAGRTRFQAYALEQAAGGRDPIVTYERAGERRTTALPLNALPIPWYRVPILLALIGCAVLILIRSPGSRQSRLLFVSFMLTAIHQSSFRGDATWLILAGSTVHLLLGGAALGSILYFLTHFPAELPSRARLSPAYPILVGLAWYAVRLDTPFGALVPAHLWSEAALLSDMAFYAGVVGIVTWNFLHCDPVGRRRLKWVIIGVYAGMVPYIALNIAVLAFPGMNLELYDALRIGAVFSFALAPIGMMIGVARYNLFDIDRILSATASHTVLIGAAAAIIIALVPGVAMAGAHWLEVDPTAIQVALSVGLVFVAVPLGRRLRPRIERIFFPERQRLEDGIGTLLVELTQQRDIQSLANLVGQRLDTLIRPYCCAMYGRLGDAEDDPFASVFVRGSAVPQTFSADHPLVQALARQTTALSVEHDGGVDLSKLGVELVIPVHRNAVLAGFIYLGGKQSGDIYTPTDVALLTALASQVSTVLVGLDGAELVRGAVEMQHSLRRYVPGAIAEQISRGADLEAAECNVSVLFVDIRGYTSFSEGREAAEIFSMINAYTRAVSRVVKAHGGTVVEFNGDGMMVVFGAPERLENKERSAVEAAREICASMAELGIARSHESDDVLAVGIGIATGPAFVGNIQSVDRLIWSAIGNTTNLAARLQALTKEYGVSIIIDANTAREAGPAADGFELEPEVMIRGRSEPQNVYLYAHHAPQASAA